jgi:hypothetical protein
MEEAERMIRSGNSALMTEGRAMREAIWLKFTKRGSDILCAAASEEEARKQLIELLLELGLRRPSEPTDRGLMIIWDQDPNNRQAHVSLSWRQASYIHPRTWEQ